MDFRTIIPVDKSAFGLTYDDRILSLGSCFSDKLGKQLERYAFQITQNPFGVLYNPMSIVKALERLWYGHRFQENELFEYNGLYGSFAHHSSFSGKDKEEVYKHICESFEQTSTALKQATCLIITFGTAWVYSLSSTGKVVANCHKMPDYLFSRRRLEVSEVVEYYTEWLNVVLEEKPDLKILMTVSPIRYNKDGAHENTLSKSILHLIVEELSLTFKQVSYFPAYELLMDDLRDYRYYEDDLIHPSPLAIKYIWEKFEDFAFDKPVKEIVRQLEQIHKAMEHKPFHPEEEDYLRFIQKNIAAVEMLQHSVPSLNLQKERSFFEQILK